MKFFEEFSIKIFYRFFQGVPILIFANKQDLPGAKEPKELEKLLGLHELSFTVIPSQMIKSASTLPVSANINGVSNLQSAQTHHNTSTTLGKYNLINSSASAKSESGNNKQLHMDTSSNCSSTPPQTSASITDASSISSSASPQKTQSSCAASSTSGAIVSSTANSFKGWYIQPACAITGDGLQEGLEALYDMIIKKRKLNKAHKKKR